MQSGGSWRKCAGKIQVILNGLGQGIGMLPALRGFIISVRKTTPETHKEILKLKDEGAKEIKKKGSLFLNSLLLGLHGKGYKKDGQR